jgi:hypothetical protein
LFDITVTPVTPITPVSHYNLRVTVTFFEIFHLRTTSNISDEHVLRALQPTIATWAIGWLGVELKLDGTWQCAARARTLEGPPASR